MSNTANNSTQSPVIRSTTSLPCRGCTVRCPNYRSCDQAPWRLRAATK